MTLDWAFFVCFFVFYMTLKSAKKGKKDGLQKHKNLLQTVSSGMWKRQATVFQKILVNHLSDKGVISRIYANHL